MGTEFEINQTHITIFDEDGSSIFDDEFSSFDEDELDFEEQEEVEPYLQEGSVFVRKYIIKRFLGQGALGITYVAEEEGSHNQVVIKEFFPKGMVKRKADFTVALGESVTQHQQSSFAKMKEVFEEEAQNIVTINTVPHKNVAGFVSLERDVNNTIYYLMPYSEGEELGDYLDRVKKEGKSLTQKEIMALVEPILRGLEHIHKYGVYHKDIKPANIYIRKDDEPLLIDFGASVTSAHLLTPSYAPIEQVKRLSSEYGAYTDLYALGVMMYEMVVGKKPPKSKLRAEAIARGESDPYLPLAKMKGLSKGFDKHFLEAIDHALALSYQERPQSAKEMGEELRGDIQRKRRNRWIILLLLSLLLFGVLGYKLYDMKRDKYGFLVVPNSNQAQILVDNRLVNPQSDGRYRVLLGEHLIEIKNTDNYLAKVSKVKLSKEGEQKRVENPLIEKEVAFEVRTKGDLVAEVEIDGKFVGNTPYRGKFYFKDLDRAYKIVVKKEGYETLEERVLLYRELMRKEITKVVLPLRKKEGTVKITSPVGFKVKVNGELIRTKDRYVDVTPLSFKRVPGVYKVLLYSSKREGGVRVYKPILKTIRVKDKEVTLFPQEKATMSKAYLRLKEREHLTPSSKKRSVLTEPKVPKMGKAYGGVRFAKTEVTYGELVRFLNDTKLSKERLKSYFSLRGKYIQEDSGSYFVSKGYESYPVVYVSWYGAKAYVDWLNRKTGGHYRLPTYEEWLAVATQGVGGVVVGELAKVAIKEPNSLGVYDLLGNVAEWSQDSVGEFSKMTLGGSFKTLEEYLNLDIKGSMNAHSTKNSDIGFRLVK